MTNWISNAGEDSVCNDLSMTLVGGDDGLDTTWANIGNFDGYKVSYTYVMADPEYYGSYGTCFGFKDDRYGYFCVGVEGDADVAGKYAKHGAGYINFNECEQAVMDEIFAAIDAMEEEKGEEMEECDQACKDALEAVVEEAVEELEEEYDYEDEEVDPMAICEGTETKEEAMARANHFDYDGEAATFVPDAECTALLVADEESGYEYETDDHCTTTEFEGSWYQPMEADTYDVNFRFTGGMWGGGKCFVSADGVEDMSEANDFVVEGAATLAAGATAVALAMFY